MYVLPKDTEITMDLLDKFLRQHATDVKRRYQPLLDLYTSNHEILRAKNKPSYKPDNRIVVNFAKYIVDTMNGFFIGHPIRSTTDDDNVAEYIEHLESYNDQDDNNAELSKNSSIFGKAYEMYYTDEDSELCITYLTPIDAFMIFDDSILERPMFFVRRYRDWENKERGSISDSTSVRYFVNDGGYRWDSEWTPHGFQDVPATEFVENEERQGVFEPSITMINAYNKAISEKANDVDYFADAYMKILGAKLDEETIQSIRDNRILNFEGDGANGIVVDFMSKPDADVTQEHLIDRLERLIFQISMVANISDESFGTSSGIALKYKLQSMSNLAKAKERKFTSGMNRRYKVLFGHPLSSFKVPEDAWTGIRYIFTQNIPNNVLEEVQAATGLQGIVSQETQLSVLSIVDNIASEIEKLREEQQSDDLASMLYKEPESPEEPEGDEEPDKEDE